MSRWRELHEFESRFPEKMSLEELVKWREYFHEHAETLAQPAKKGALKRLHAIDRAMEGLKKSPQVC
jgi:hypothetical protein